MSEGNQENSSEPGKRIDPILVHLDIEDLDKEKIREHFIQLWQFEDADSLSPEEQFLSTIGIFIYTAHATLDDININQVKARGFITEAFTKWLQPEIDALVEKEKASDNPFKTFVENNVPKVDDVYTWRHFMLETKKADEKEWNYKMKQCWFSQFFIRLGRTDWIETACMFDKIPSEARKDYVNLKLSNTFAKLGSFCQFRYTPKS